MAGREAPDLLSALTALGTVARFRTSDLWEALAVSNRGTRGRLCCGARWAWRSGSRRRVTGEARGCFCGMRAGRRVMGRDPGVDHWRDDGGRVLAGSRAGTGPGRLRPGPARLRVRRPPGSRSAG